MTAHGKTALILRPSDTEAISAGRRSQQGAYIADAMFQTQDHSCVWNHHLFSYQGLSWNSGQLSVQLRRVKHSRPTSEFRLWVSSLCGSVGGVGSGLEGLDLGALWSIDLSGPVRARKCSRLKGASQERIGREMTEMDYLSKLISGWNVIHLNKKHHSPCIK